MFVTPGSRGGRGIAANTLYPLIAEPISIPYASTLVLDLGFGRRNNFVIGSLTGNMTLANPVNMRVGQQIYIELPQDATGSRTISYGSYFKFAGGTPTASTAANSIDAIVGEVTSLSTIRCSFLKAFA